MLATIPFAVLERRAFRVNLIALSPNFRLAPDAGLERTGWQRGVEYWSAAAEAREKHSRNHHSLRWTGCTSRG
jgi:hypothetical protein